LKLDLNRLRKQGFVRPGARTGPLGIQWTNSYTGETTAFGLISGSMDLPGESWFRIELGHLNQRITLVPRRRHFGGYQWYFICPATNRLVSVLWRPPGASRFCSRYAWGRQVAYASQFETPSDRAWRAQGKIKARLIGELDPDEWDLPPKPKWMRWSTYNRLEARFDHYEDVLDTGLLEIAARLLGRR